VAITVFVGKRPYGYVRTQLKQRSTGHTYTAMWAPPNVKGPLRFCAEAYDPLATRARVAAPASSRNDARLDRRESESNFRRSGYEKC
jgi:hypothetical protein